MNNKKNAPDYLFTLILINLLMHISNFFNTALKHFSEKPNVLVRYVAYVILHIIYIGLLTFPIAGVTFLIINFHSIAVYSASLKEGLWIVIKIISIFFTLIFILNINNPRYRLPGLIISILVILYTLLSKVTFKNTLPFLIMAGLFGYLCRSLYKATLELARSYINFNDQIYLFVVFMCLLLFLTLITEATSKPLSKSLQKFFLWLVLFIGVISLTIHQLQNQLTEEKIEIEGILSLILGVFFSFALVLDKGREAYNKLLENKEILSNIRYVNNEYLTYKKMKHKFFTTIISLESIKLMLKNSLHTNPFETITASVGIIIFSLLYIYIFIYIIFDNLLFI